MGSYFQQQINRMFYLELFTNTNFCIYYKKNFWRYLLRKVNQNCWFQQDDAAAHKLQSRKFWTNPNIKSKFKYSDILNSFKTSTDIFNLTAHNYVPILSLIVFKILGTLKIYRWYFVDYNTRNFCNALCSHWLWKAFDHMQDTNSSFSKPHE